YSTAAERAFTGGAAGLGQFVRFAGPLALVWAGRSFVRTRGGCSYRWGDAFDCRSTASVRTESNQYTEPAHSHPGRVLLPVLRGNEKAPASFDARAFDMAQRTG